MTGKGLPILFPGMGGPVASDASAAVDLSGKTMFEHRV
jgi:hypothetical protein